MKKLHFALALALCALSLNAQDIYLYYADGTFSSMPLNALDSISFFAPDITPEESVPEPDDPTDGSRLIVIQFNDTICEGHDIALVGDYNGWAVDDVDALLKFKPYDLEEGDWNNWYYVTVPAELNKDTLPAKPVQLSQNEAGEWIVDWNYQTGDAASWTIVSGTVEVVPGYSGEADVNWISQAAVAKSAGWKLGYYPCKPKVIENFTVNVKCTGFVPCIVGDFNRWADHVEMTLVADAADTYTYNFDVNVNEGCEFHITNGDWTSEVVMAADYNLESGCYNRQYNTRCESGKNTIDFVVAGLSSELVMCE